MAKISETGQPKTLAHRWTYDGDKVLVVRQCAHDGSSSHGFVWPKSGPVECPDWQPHNNCGNGLHGWPWGLAMGDGAEPNFTSLWLVVAVDPKDIIDVEDAHGKVKFKAGEVVFAGEWWKARELTEKGRNAWIVHFSDGKSSATGYGSASSATGDSSASSATGYSSASSATGYRSASSATGDSSASSATGHGSASSATGYGSASSATGYRSASSATGDESASSATGDRSASSATGDRSASSATGNRSASSATGNSSASSATGDASVAVCTGTESTARAGEWGVIALAWWNKRANRAEMRCARVVDGKRGTLKPGVAYRLNGRGRFVEVKAEVADAG